MNFDNYPLIGNNCNHYAALLKNVVESKNKDEFYYNLKEFNNFCTYLSSSFDNTCKGITNPEEKITFLDGLVSFYTNVSKEIKTYIKWVKDRYKINKAPTYKIVDFLADLSHDVYEKTINMKDKKFNVMVKVKG